MNTTRLSSGIAKRTQGKCLCIAGTGSNNTREALEATQHAAQAGVDAVLLVDPYYNGPSSLEIRREYVAPIAAAFPDLQVIPYVIPGRTGAQLLPEDLGAFEPKTQKRVERQRSHRQPREHEADTHLLRTRLHHPIR